MLRAIPALGLIAATAAVAGCGSSDSKPVARLPRQAPGPRNGAPAHANPQPSREMTRSALDDVRPTIVGWGAALRRDDSATAGRYFALPVVIQQAGGEVAVSTPAALSEFNASLPCGARVTKTQAAGHYAVASFELTARPGHKCADVGQTVRVALAFKGHQIVEWRQLPDAGEPAPNPADSQA